MALRISLFYAAVFLAIGIMLPFWPVWLKARGLTPAEIGLLLSTAMWIRAFTNPLIATVADRTGRPDRLLAALAWAALAAQFLFLPAYGFWPLLFVNLLASMLFAPVMPLGDAVTMLKVREGTLDYGRVRLWGSITFILAATLGGLLLEGRPPELILWLIIGAMAVTVAICHLMPEARTPGTARLSAPLREILRNRPVILFMLAGGVLQASHGVYYGFATLHWQASGLSAGVIGALWAEGVVAEILLFAFSRRVVARFSPVAMMGVAAAAGVVRWIALGLTDGLPVLVAVQGLHAFTFGAAHLAAMHYIAREVPASYAATAQSLYSSTAMGCLMALSMMASGWLFEAHGGAAFLAMAAVSAAGGLIAVALRRRESAI
jgi:PPP family 3-phenylpropionic acid transporter